MAISWSRIRSVFIVALVLVTGTVVVAQTVIRSPASQFPGVRIETNGTNGAPSLTWVNSLTTGFFYTGTTGQIGVAGALVPGAGSTYDLGTSGSPFRNLYLSGAFAVGSVGFGDGSSGAPSIFFTSAATLGLYNAGTGAIGATGVIRAASGASGTPTYSFASAPGVGLYWVSGTLVGLTGSLQPSASATYALGATGSRWTTGWFSSTITTAAGVQIGDGNAGAPTLAFASQTTLGFYKFGAGILGVTGPLLPSADNTDDLGTISANAWRSGFFKGSLNAGILRLGALTSTTNDSLLRNEFVSSSGAYGIAMTAFTNAAQTAFGDVRMDRVAAGTSGGDPTFTAGGLTTVWNLYDTEATIPGSAESLVTNLVQLQASFTAIMTANVLATKFVTFLEPLHNLTATGPGRYGGSYQAVYADGFTDSVATPGTIPELDATVSDTEFGGNGTVQALFSWAGILGTYDPFSGTLGVVSRTGFLHLTPPFQGAVDATTHSAIWIEDQTNGGAYTPTNNYWLELDTVGGTHNTLGTAAGLLGLFGAAPTTDAPLKVGGTLASVRFDDGNSGTAKTIDLSTGNSQKLTLTGNVTLTLTNPTDSGTYNLEIFTGTGGFTATWPASVKWPAGTPPTITVTAGRVDVIHLVYDATSGDYFGSFSQNITP
jgi:hypothetical protein